MQWQSYWRRYRAVAAAVCVAAAGYYAYAWYFSDGHKRKGAASELQSDSASGAEHPADADALEEEVGQLDGGAPNDSSHNTRVCKATGAQRQIHQHVESVQAIAQETTIPALLPAVRTAIAANEHFGVQPVYAGLQALRAQTPQANATHKLTLWSELRARSMLSLVAATWAVPAHELLMHAMLMVLGRHSFLGSMTAGSNLSTRPTLARAGTAGKAAEGGAPEATAPIIWDLSPAQEHAYMVCSGFFADKGIQGLLHSLHAVVQEAVQDVDLQQLMSLDQVLELLSTVHARVDSMLSIDDWVSFLLPEVEQRTPSVQALNDWIAQPQAAPAGVRDVLQQPAGSIGPPAMPVLESSPSAAMSVQSSVPELVQPTCHLVGTELPHSLGDADSNIVAMLVYEVRSAMKSPLLLTALRTGAQKCAAMCEHMLQEHAMENRLRNIHSSEGGSGGSRACSKAQGDVADAEQSDGRPECSLKMAKWVPLLQATAMQMLESDSGLGGMTVGSHEGQLALLNMYVVANMQAEEQEHERDAL